MLETGVGSSRIFRWPRPRSSRQQRPGPDADFRFYRRRCWTVRFAFRRNGEIIKSSPRCASLTQATGYPSKCAMSIVTP